MNLTLALALTPLTACTTDLGYAAAQTWQRQQCQKIHDEAERRRCLLRADTPHDRYEQQREGLSPKR